MDVVVGGVHLGGLDLPVVLDAAENDMDHTVDHSSQQAHLDRMSGAPMRQHQAELPGRSRRRG